MNKPILYSVPDVAEILGCNRDYVYKLHKAGLLKFLKIGRLKCRHEALQEFLARYEGYDITNPYEVRTIKGGQDEEA